MEAVLGALVSSDAQARATAHELLRSDEVTEAMRRPETRTVVAEGVSWPTNTPESAALAFVDEGHVLTVAGIRDGPRVSAADADASPVFVAVTVHGPSPGTTDARVTTSVSVGFGPFRERSDAWYTAESLDSVPRVRVDRSP